MKKPTKYSSDAGYVAPIDNKGIDAARVRAKRRTPEEMAVVRSLERKAKEEKQAAIDALQKDTDALIASMDHYERDMYRQYGYYHGYKGAQLNQTFRDWRDRRAAEIKATVERQRIQAEKLEKIRLDRINNPPTAKQRAEWLFQERMAVPIKDDYPQGGLCACCGVFLLEGLPYAENGVNKRFYWEYRQPGRNPLHSRHTLLTESLTIKDGNNEVLIKWNNV